MVRLAVLGATGKWAANILRTLGTLPDVEVPWRADSRTDWRALLERERPAGVVIATPAPVHAAMALHAIGLRLPVFVEKPLTLSLPDALAVRDAAAAAGVPVVVDHVHLFSGAFRELRRRLPALGPVAEAESQGGNRGPFRPEISPLWDWAPHDVSIALALAGGAPASVTGTDAGGGNHRIDMHFPGRFAWRATVGSGFPDRLRRVRIKAAGGEAVWDDLAAAKLTIDGLAVPVEAPPPLTAALRAFLEAAAGRPEAAAVSGADLGVEVVRVLAACGPAQP